MATFGETLRVLRIKRNLSQAQLADAVHLKRSAIGNYERGIREPDLDTIELLADYFDVSVDDIMGREEGDLPQTQSAAPRTVEARIVSGWMDDLPKEQRERILSIFRAMFDNDPKLFREEEG